MCIAIAPLEQTPVPVGVPKTGYMIESMVTATALNIGQLVRGETVTHEATWNAICLADFGDSGVAFVAMPQNPPRNVNWASRGRWVMWPRSPSRSTSCTRSVPARPSPTMKGR